jgi:hypothetical protein
MRDGKHIPASEFHTRMEVSKDTALLRTAITILRVYLKKAKCQPGLNRRTKNWLKRNNLVDN